MIESFVDLSYRGLPLGRRIKLTQVRPSTGYLEMPTPMPVGTQIELASDDGVMLDAVVMQVHEQVGGSDHAPGMTIKPRLVADSQTSWWTARVALPEEDPKSTRPIVRPAKPPESPPPAAAVPTPAPAIATEPLFQQAAASTSEPPPVPRPPVLPTSSSSEPPAPRTTGRAQTILGTGPQTITADEPPAAVRESRADSSGLMRTMTADEPPPAERASRVDSSGLLHTLVADEVTDTTPLKTITADEPPAAARTSRVDSSGLMRTMDAVAPDIEQTSTGTSGEYAVVDDGQQTTTMDAVDPASLGLEMTASGRFKPITTEPSNSRAATEVSVRATSESDVDDDSGDTTDGDGDKPKPLTGGPGTKKRRKKR